MGLTALLTTASLTHAQIGSGVGPTQYPANAYQGPTANRSQAAPASHSSTQAARSQRSAGRGSLSAALFGTRNNTPGGATPTPAAAAPRMAPRQPVQPTPATVLTPSQVYAQAYNRALNSGYPAPQAQAYGRQMMQQYQARLAAAQQAQMAVAAGQQPAPVHASMLHQHTEEQRVRMSHQMMAAQQNAQLWQSIQQQRVRAAQQAALAQQQQIQQARLAQQNAIAQAQAALADSYSEAEAIRNASLQIARQLARESNAVLKDDETRQTANPIAVEVPNTTQTLRNGMLAPSVPPSTATINRTVPTQVAPPSLAIPSQAVPTPSVLDTEELNLDGPALELGQPVPSDVEWEMPAEVQQLPTESPNELRRTPRKLPDVEPNPLPKPAAEPEVPALLREPAEQPGLELEGPSVEPVSYQQPLGQSYGAQGYAPELTAPVGEELQGQTAELYEQQLQTAPPQLTYDDQRPNTPPARNFSVETDRSMELESSDPIFAPTNQDWNGLPSDRVQPPTGIRAQPAVARLGGPGSKRGGFPIARPYQDQEQEQGNVEPEALPAPRNYREELGGGSVVRSCDQLRDELLNQSISKISLDLSTPLNDITLRDVADSQRMREWRSPEGEVVARGKPVSATRYGINIVDAAGLPRTLSLSSLSDSDQRYAWELIDLPFECELVTTHILDRNFTPSTVTWYASALCHKPLYFEDIQLERYGHTKGPIRQPVRSAARFLGQAALLPYQMGIHPPNECQYSLGLFRPGSCAPYLRTPFPWERRAVGYEAAALAGVFLLIP